MVRHAALYGVDLQVFSYETYSFCICRPTAQHRMFPIFAWVKRRYDMGDESGIGCYSALGHDGERRRVPPHHPAPA